MIFWNTLRRINFQGYKRSFSEMANVQKNNKIKSYFKQLYFSLLPLSVGSVFITSLLSDTTHPDEYTKRKITFYEIFIFCVTKGIIIGYTYPVSFPFIALNFLRKKYFNKPGGEVADRVNDGGVAGIIYNGDDKKK